MVRGYVNLRYAWEPGCTQPLRPNNATLDIDRPEAMVWSGAWQELFPDRPVPKEVAQPASAQFAVSRARVLSRPVGDYEHFRHWLVRTPLDSSVSGGVWEYLWHIVFGCDVKLYYLWTSVSVAHTIFARIEDSCLGRSI
jgi:Protein of unknown function (DUF3431)